MLFVPSAAHYTNISHSIVVLFLPLYSATHSLPKIHESPYSVFGFTSKCRTSVRVWIWLCYLLVYGELSTHTHSTQTHSSCGIWWHFLWAVLGFLSSTGNGCRWLLTRIHLVYIRSRRNLMNSACVHVRIRPGQSHIWNDLSNPCSSTCTVCF